MSEQLIGDLVLIIPAGVLGALCVLLIQYVRHRK